MENKIIQGDCLEKMKELQAESIDLIVTDPPYGYSFMGKDWDKVVVGVPTWKECLRVLKPGGFAFVMSAPRQDVLAHMMINLSDAGFETGFTSIYWAYATGMPKSMNMAKAVDKKLGIEQVKEEYEHPQRMNRSYTASVGFSEVDDRKGDHTRGVATSEEAKKLDGSYAGYQPKPAVEVIIVCMKLLNKKNYVEQALYNGKGITWLNDCRIPYTSEADMPATRVQGERTSDSVFNKETCGFNKPVTMEPSPDGRFPANLLVSDNVIDNGVITKGVSGGGPKEYGGGGGWEDKINRQVVKQFYNDKGEFSRYFDLDKWWANFIVTPKASKSEKNKGLEEFEEKKYDGRFNNAGEWKQMEKLVGKNTHPTVKPIKLMSYLITLGSREGDIVLDPFMGSGTTCLSASLLGRKYIGIEREVEYCKIAEGRMNGLSIEQSNIG